MKRHVIYLLLAITSSLTHAASFDCAKAATQIEKLICSDSQLSDLDSQLMLAYKNKISTAQNIDVVKFEQREWLSTVRNKCTDAACIKNAYSERIATLSGNPISPTIQEQIAIKAEPPKEIEAAPVTSTPAVTNPSSAIQPTASPSMPQIAEPKVKSVVETKTATEPAPAETPSYFSSLTISEVFRNLFALGMLILIIGMIRPALAKRFIKEPSRKKIFLSMLIYLVPVAIMVNVAKSPEEKAHDLAMSQQHETNQHETNPVRSTNKGNQYHPNSYCDQFVVSAKSYRSQGDEAAAKNELALYADCKRLE